MSAGAGVHPQVTMCDQLTSYLSKFVTPAAAAAAAGPAAEVAAIDGYKVRPRPRVCWNGMVACIGSNLSSPTRSRLVHDQPPALPGLTFHPSINRAGISPCGSRVSDFDVSAGVPESQGCAACSGCARRHGSVAQGKCADTGAVHLFQVLVKKREDADDLWGLSAAAKKGGKKAKKGAATRASDKPVRAPPPLVAAWHDCPGVPRMQSLSSQALGQRVPRVIGERLIVARFCALQFLTDLIAEVDSKYSHLQKHSSGVGRGLRRPLVEHRSHSGRSLEPQFQLLLLKFGTDLFVESGHECGVHNAGGCEAGAQHRHDQRLQRAQRGGAPDRVQGARHARHARRTQGALPQEARGGACRGCITPRARMPVCRTRAKALWDAGRAASHTNMTMKFLRGHLC